MKSRKRQGGDSETFAREQLSNMVARKIGGELKEVTFKAGEEDQGENSRIRNFLLEGTYGTRSVAEIAFRGTLEMFRGKNKPWSTGLVGISFHVNPDHPITFHTREGRVIPE
ncbi:MAG TPA: hypothetical protein VMA75_00435 [Candidatus Paceibacterota bacterium]|nr:hypothetical protein [Candidatus Paceibacterota bacterium]